MERVPNTIHPPFMIKSLHTLDIGIVLVRLVPPNGHNISASTCSSRTCRNLLSRMQQK